MGRLRLFFRNEIGVFLLACSVAVFGTAACGAAACGAQQLPPGTHSVDDPTQANAAAAQMRDAEAALEQQDYKTAEAKLKALLASSSESAKNGRALYDLGFAQEHLGEDDAAVRSYAASVAALPGFAEPQVSLGLLDARAGRTAAAHKELEAAAKLETASPAMKGRALRALARLDEAQQPEAAQAELLAALRLTPETPDDVLMGAELAERGGDAADAETAYRRALAMMPGDENATAGLAHVLQQQKKFAEAEAVLMPALKAHPDDPRIVAEAATLYASEGKAKEAIPLIEQMRAKDAAVAADPRVTRTLAGLYAVSGDDADALKLDMGLLTADAGDPTLLDDIGSAQVRLGQYAEAEATMQKAVAMRAAFHDDTAWALAESHLAFAASKNHDPKTTLAALGQRSTVLPDTASSLFLEATAYDTLRQRVEAAKAYKAFLAAANGKFPDEEFEARHRLIALQGSK